MENYIQDILGNVCMFASLLILCRKTPRRDLFWVRLPLSFVAFCALRFIIFSLLLPLLPPPVDRILNMAAFALIFALLWVVVRVCYDCDFWMALFCANIGYSMQHVAQRLYMICNRTFSNDMGNWNILLYLFMIVLVLALLYLAVRRLRITKIIVASRTLLLVSTLIVGTAVILDLVMFEAIRSGWDIRTLYYISSMIIAVLIMMVQVSLIRKHNVEMERDTLKEILENEREQYLYEKQMIDAINIKLHDLKHQLAGGAQVSEEMKEAIGAYERNYRTENVALDVILTRKSFSCREKGIEFTCMADGRLLSFMKETEIYSLFGNILDNAIEAVEALEDEKKRIITLNVEKRGWFVVIREENYFSGRLQYEDGLPRTTKVDKYFHGYGMKSIRSIVKKYDGELKVDTPEDRFVLKIAIPIQGGGQE